MIAELGTFALIIAFCLTVIQAAFPLIGMARKGALLDLIAGIATLAYLSYFISATNLFRTPLTIALGLYLGLTLLHGALMAAAQTHPLRRLYRYLRPLVLGIVLTLLLYVAVRLTFSIFLATAVSIVLLQLVVPSVHRGITGNHYAALARSMALGQFVFVAISFACLVYLFVTDDFSIQYVASNSNTKLPLLYKVSAVWGAHEGSLLLWTLILSTWTAAITVFSRTLPAVYTARIIAVMGLISIGFILFVLVTSNPFTPIYYQHLRFTPEFYTEIKNLLLNAKDPTLSVILNKFGISVESAVASKFYLKDTADQLINTLNSFHLQDYFQVRKIYVPSTEGRDLNPLLQDPGLAFHPPLLYMGYVGFSVAFSFAIAALLGGRLDSAWARWSRPWTTIAWIFLTLGITLGSWWAYYELGWGGWWFWDPVENASFMPWLVGTALIHSLAVTEKRNTFRTWTVILAIIAFSLSLLGTFLVRSGILNSVHSFTSDPLRGYFVLNFLFWVIGGSLILYTLRAPKIKSVGWFDLFSRETLLLINNILLVIVAATVLWGTLYPIIANAQDKSISVGAQWFNRYFVALMLPLSFLAAIGPVVRWKNDSFTAICKRMLPHFLLSLGTGLLLAALSDAVTLYIGLVISVAVWVLLGSLESLFYRLRRMPSIRRAVFGMSQGAVGTLVAHAGIAVFIVGVCFTSINSVKQTEKMRPGQSVSIGDYRYRFISARWAEGPNYNAYQGLFYVYDKGRKVAELHPQKRYYLTQKRQMTEAGIDPGFQRDLLVSMGDPLDKRVANFLTLPHERVTPQHIALINDKLKQTDWVVILQYKPFMRWVWFGAVLMALGGLIAALDKRYRIFSSRKLDKIRSGETQHQENPS